MSGQDRTAARAPTPRRMRRFREVVARRQSGLVVVLENIHDPHNAEAALRSCEAFGVPQVHLIFTSEAPFNPRKVGTSTSSSANKWLDFTIHDSTDACMRELTSSGFELVASVADPAATTASTADLRAPRIALLLGNEHSGLSAEALAAADARLTIPTSGMVGSLNLSVATGILLYEVCRQRSERPGDYALSELEQERLIGNYLRR